MWVGGDGPTLEPVADNIRPVLANTRRREIIVRLKLLPVE
jgi:hypothetical protein